MSTKCKICNHSQRADIEKAIAKGAPSVNYRKIAKQFQVPESSLRRHGANHFAIVLAEAQDKAADKLAEQIVINTAALHDFVYLSPKEAAQFAMHNLMLDIEDLNRTRATDQMDAAFLKAQLQSPFERSRTKVTIWREILRYLDYIAKLEGHYSKDREETPIDKYEEFARMVDEGALLHSQTFEEALPFYLNMPMSDGKGGQITLREKARFSNVDIQKIKDAGARLEADRLHLAKKVN
jgi:hypothetical protein